MNISRNLSLLLWWIVLVVIGVGVLIIPSIRSTQQLSSEIEELKERIDANNDGAAALRRLEAELLEARRMVERETTPIPRDGDVAALIRQLTSRLSDLGVEEREITTGSATAHDDASSMPMSVSIKTEFLNIYDVVRWVESLPRLVRVQRLSVKRPRSDDDRSEHVEADVMLEVFFNPSQALAGADQDDS